MIVNIGDMLSEMSKGYFISTKHRVVNPTGVLARQNRLAMPLFIHPKSDVRLSERYTAGQYRNERFAQIGLPSDSE